SRFLSSVMRASLQPPWSGWCSRTMARRALTYSGFLRKLWLPPVLRAWLAMEASPRWSGALVGRFGVLWSRAGAAGLALALPLYLGRCAECLSAYCISRFRFRISLMNPSKGEACRGDQIYWAASVHRAAKGARKINLASRVLCG